MTEFISPTGESGALDGSTAEKFDSLMRSFPEGAIINLLPGTFLTTGSWSYNEVNGFRVKAGWKVIGAGMDQTTVRVTAFPTWASPISHGVFQMDIYDGGGSVEISDLTIDEDWLNLGAAKANSSFAANLYGNNCTIRRVRPINGHGDRESLMESFTFFIGARHDGTKWEDNTGGLIEECKIPGLLYHGDYGIGMLLAGGADGLTGSVSGVVRNNEVTDFIGTAAFGIGSNTILEGNITRGCRQSFYCDVAAQNSTLRRNRINDSIWAAIHCAPSMGLAQITNLLIEDNEIELSGTTPHDAGIQLWSSLGRGHLSNITARRNRFTVKNGSIADTKAISAQDVDGLTVEDNILAEGLLSKLNYSEHLNTQMLLRGNRTLSGSIPPGLEDSPSNPNPMETLIDQLETSITAQTALIADISTTVSGLRQQLASAQASEASLKIRLEKLLVDTQANQAALTAAVQP